MVFECKRDQPQYPNITAIFVMLICSILIGIYIGAELKMCDQLTLPKIKNEVKEDSNDSEVATQELLFSLAGQEFACDPLRAYEELSRLRKKATDLSLAENKQANNARNAVVARKSAQAAAAQVAFRTCVDLMMPELLQKWDKDFKEHRVSFRGWSEKRETDMGGITKETLEETADMLDKNYEPLQFAQSK